MPAGSRRPTSSRHRRGRSRPRRSDPTRPRRAAPMRPRRSSPACRCRRTRRRVHRGRRAIRRVLGGSSLTMTARAPPRELAVRRAVGERGAQPRVAAAVAGLRGLGRREDLRPERLEHREQRPDVAGARDLEEAGRDDPRDLGAVGEHDLPAAHEENVLPREVRADRTEVLGRGHRREAQRHAAGRRVAPVGSRRPPGGRARRAPCASPRSATARSR